jgi:L-tryptophan--pyruvate aminotransferase
LGHYQVVIGNGATQVIQAAIWALNSQRVFARRPYFQRFPVMSRMAEAEWVRDDDFAKNKFYPQTTEIVTSPNNPDGEIYLEPALEDNRRVIFDACYNWPQYMRNNQPIPMNKDLMVYSLAKATGHAGTRIGWALVADPHIAASMRDFIEYQSCGVSIEAQQKAYAVIHDHLLGFDSVMNYGWVKLTGRWDRVVHAGLTAERPNGMFLWIQEPSKDYFKKHEILGIDGERFGREGWIRLNMGCSDEDFEEFMDRVGLYDKYHQEYPPKVDNDAG